GGRRRRGVGGLPGARPGRGDPARLVAGPGADRPGARGGRPRATQGRRHSAEPDADGQGEGDADRLRRLRPVKGANMAHRWFYSHNGSTLGPVSARQLKYLAATGGLQPEDLIW